MGRDESRFGCGWLLLLTGVLALGVAVVAWLIALERRQPDDRGDLDVWITQSGAHYHRRECPALARSSPVRTTLAEAIDEGLTACGLCDPPM